MVCQGHCIDLAGSLGVPITCGGKAMYQKQNSRCTDLNVAMYSDIHAFADVYHELLKVQCNVRNGDFATIFVPYG